MVSILSNYKSISTVFQEQRTNDNLHKINIKQVQQEPNTLGIIGKRLLYNSLTDIQVQQKPLYGVGRRLFHGILTITSKPAVV